MGIPAADPALAKKPGKPKRLGAACQALATVDRSLTTSQGKTSISGKNRACPKKRERARRLKSPLAPRGRTKRGHRAALVAKPKHHAARLSAAGWVLNSKFQAALKRLKSAKLCQTTAEPAK
jgi:hypothetical protein